MHRVAILVALCSAGALAADGPDGGAAPSTFADLDALWLQRDQPGAQDKLLQLTADGVRDHPQDFEVLWRAARIRLWAADGESGDKKRDIAKEAWDLGDRATKARPQAVEGNYYAAASIGSYSQAVGILNALAQGLESKFNERLDKAIAIDSKYAHAAPPAVKGRYYFELPWPKRNLRKSADWLKKALGLDPSALRPLVWLAETQWRDGDPAAARASLAKVEAGSMPDDPAEERRCKELGKKLAAEMDKEH
ncbi:MAG TPA: hypothetical protein VEJ89_12815 [Myxococcaceae bacterium]|jgi:hypothetical protein|nr:hypothetical protein [Myxococcaceae bacterium]